MYGVKPIPISQRLTFPRRAPQHRLMMLMVHVFFGAVMGAAYGALTEGIGRRKVRPVDPQGPVHDL